MAGIVGLVPLAALVTVAAAQPQMLGMQNGQCGAGMGMGGMGWMGGGMGAGMGGHPHHDMGNHTHNGTMPGHNCTPPADMPHGCTHGQ